MVGTTTAATTTAEAATASAAFESARAGRLSGRPAQRLAQLFEAYAAMVLGICRGMLRNVHDAEDAAQQTFLSAYTSLAAGTVPREPAAWLATIARNECRTRAHRRMREQIPEHELEAAGGVDPADEAVRADEVESLRHALAQLPGQQRHAFLLREFSGLSYDELADELGVTRPAVESLLFRARQQLRLSLRTALAGLTSVPMSVRDWLAQLFSSSPEAPAAAAKLATLGVVAKIAAATAGTALVAASMVAVAPHRQHQARAAPALAPPANASVKRVHRRTPRVMAAPVSVHLVAAPRPVASSPVRVGERHRGAGESGPSGRSSGETGSSGHDGQTLTTSEREHEGSSSSGPGPSRSDQQTTVTSTAATASGEGSHGSDGGGGDGHGGSDGGGSDGDASDSSGGD